MAFSDWSKKIKIVIDHTKIEEDVTYFPLTIFLSTNCGLNNFDASDIFNELGNNKLKLAVYQSDKSTQLYVEIEHWDSTNKEAVLHVSRSGWTISSTEDTVIWLCYDKNQPDNTSYVGEVGSTPAQNVWDSDFFAVYHFKDTLPKDSTSNGRDFTTSYGTPEVVNEHPVLGKSLQLIDTDSERILTSDYDCNVLNSAFTIETVMRIDNLVTDWQRFFGCGLANNGDIGFVRYSTSSHMNVGIYGDDLEGSLDLDAGNWHYWSHFFDSSDGILECDRDNETDSNTNSVSPNIGTQAIVVNAGQDASHIGCMTIKEARISKVERSLGWRRATYYSLFDNLLSFYDGKISGQVTLEGSPVQGAIIRVICQDDKTYVGDTTTDANGNYEIYVTKNKKYHIVVEYTDGSGNRYNATSKWDIIPTSS